MASDISSLTLSLSNTRLSSGIPEFDDEALDPRIQIELEKLNKSSDEINRVELDLDDARSSFRLALSESTQCLNGLSKKLSTSIEKARPYYDARMKAKETQVETQKAALRFERACSMHEAAKEMVQLAEQGYMKKGEAFESAWQEMLNHGTMKVNEAEKERIESEKMHADTAMVYNEADQRVQKLQKELKRAVVKSRPYFDQKAKFNQILDEKKKVVSKFEELVSSAKLAYAAALHSLEEISESIHRQRVARIKEENLGVRGAGVGAESPSPPTTRRHISEGSDLRASRTAIAEKSKRRASGNAKSYPGAPQSPPASRRQSYRKAIASVDLSKSLPLDESDNFGVLSLEEEYIALPSRHSPRGQPRSETEAKSKSETFIDPLGLNESQTPDSPRLPSTSLKFRPMSVPHRVCHVSRDHSPAGDSQGSASPSGGRKKLQGIILSVNPMLPVDTDRTSRGTSYPTQAVYMSPQFHRGRSHSEPPDSADYQHDSTAAEPVHRDQNLPESTKSRTQSMSVAHSDHTVPQSELNVPQSLRVDRSDPSKDSVAQNQTHGLSPLTPVTPAITPTRPGIGGPALLAVQDSEETMSDTESITSAGPVMDNDMLEMLTLAFPDENQVEEEEVEIRELRRVESVKRASLPPRLSHLQRFVHTEAGGQRVLLNEHEDGDDDEEDA